MDSFADPSENSDDVEEVAKVNPFAQFDSFAENSADFADMPSTFEMPKSAHPGKSLKRKQKDLEVFDIDEQQELSVEDSDDDVDPDPAFEINAKAARKYRQRIRDMKIERKKTNILRIQTQESKRQRLLTAKADTPLLLSKNETKALKLIQRKEAGQPMDELYLKDTDNVVTIICDSPYQDKIDQLLGVDKHWNHCYGCTHGVCYTKSEEDPVTGLNNYIADNWGSGREDIQATLISHYYEREIRTKTNANFKGHGVPLPPWKPRQVYECLNHHKIMHDELWRISKLRNLAEDNKHLQRSKYAYPSVVEEQEREATIVDLFIHPEKHKMQMDILKMEILLRKTKFDAQPKISGVNAPISINFHNNNIISGKTNILTGVTQTRITDWTKVKKGV